MTLALTIDSRWGGFYFMCHPVGYRLCVGWIALDFFHKSIDKHFKNLIKKSVYYEEKSKCYEALCELKLEESYNQEPPEEGTIS